MNIQYIYSIYSICVCACVCMYTDQLIHIKQHFDFLTSIKPDVTTQSTFLGFLTKPIYNVIFLNK